MAIIAEKLKYSLVDAAAAVGYHAATVSMKRAREP
jgi:hypothetical protein